MEYWSTLKWPACVVAADAVHVAHHPAHCSHPTFGNKSESLAADSCHLQCVHELCLQAKSLPSLLWGHSYLNVYFMEATRRATTSVQVAGVPLLVYMTRETLLNGNSFIDYLESTDLVAYSTLDIPN